MSRLGGPSPTYETGSAFTPVRQTDYEAAMRALWECLLLSGADVSPYALQTRTEDGREMGFREWMRHGNVEEVAEAVRQLREDYDDD